MKNLNAFLNPVRKPNHKFVLSDAFVDEDGKPIEWELRLLTAEESLEISKEHAHSSYGEVIFATIARSLVYPNLRDKELLEALSKREGRQILEAKEALKVMINDPEYSRLASEYLQYANIKSFDKQVETAKN